MNETPETPSAEEAQPASALEPSDYNQFLLHSRSEVLFVLRGLIENVSQITVFFNEGKDLLLTAVAAADENSLVLDFGASAEMNRKALSAQKLFCITTLDKVKIQFILKGLQAIEYEGRPSFRAELPDTLLRLQRREYYRLTTPVTRPLLCLIPLAEGEQALEIPVVDLSGGGMALAVPEHPAFTTGREFPNCRIDLPEVGEVVATLRVRSLFEITLRSGAVLRRSGCEFVDLPGAAMTLIQRYIIKVERERKARELGLA